mmetsp:Transcript_2019/g.3772  ORF Transcript_2019/g.3772 Transcript_2019/m.3772 type:complete len:242 (+) Transcript_2019:36-761(+)
MGREIIQRKKPPPPPVGAHIGNPAELTTRLAKKWNGPQVVDSLKYKIKEYEQRYGVLDGNTFEKSGDKELAILQKVVEDGEGIMQMQPSEKATLDLIQNGFRDYVDFALDELGRHARIISVVDSGTQGFEWRKQGNASDNPCLRRSMVLNTVADGHRRFQTQMSTVEYNPDATDLKHDTWWLPETVTAKDRWGGTITPAAASSANWGTTMMTASKTANSLRKDLSRSEFAPAGPPDRFSLV